MRLVMNDAQLVEPEISNDDAESTTNFDGAGSGDTGLDVGDSGSP